MRNSIFIAFCIAGLCMLAINFTSCSKPDSTPTNPCAGKTIVVTGTTNPTSGGSTTNGTINATATGSSGFTYNLNGECFEASVLLKSARIKVRTVEELLLTMPASGHYEQVTNKKLLTG